MANPVPREEWPTLGKLFETVFLPDCKPFEELFQDAAPQRLVMHLDNGYSLDQEQFLALVGAAQSVADQSLILSEAEVLGAFTVTNPYQARHWRLTMPVSYSDYPVPGADSALYSPSGQWGVWVSHEYTAFVGGTAAFIGRFKELYPAWEQRMAHFCDRWKESTWYPSFIAHLRVHEPK